MLMISVLSTEYIVIDVTATKAGVPISLTSDPVAWAFTTPGGAPTSWITGDWAAGQARVLIGPTANPLAAGVWDAWLKITDSPEIPVRRVGQVVAF